MPFVIKLTMKLNNNNHMFLMNLKHMSINDFMFNSVNLNHLTNIYVLSPSEISAKYQDLMEVFFKVNINKLSPHWDYINHHIPLEEKFKSVYDFIYNLSKTEFSVMKKHLKKNLEKGFICLFTFLWELSVLFVKKPDSSLWMCIDYHTLNWMTIKNHYLFSLISELLNWVKGTKFFIKLDLRSAFNLLYIIEGN
jgi:hypothetical protein